MKIGRPDTILGKQKISLYKCVCLIGSAPGDASIFLNS